MVELLFGTRNSRNNEPSERCRSKQSSEEAVEAMPKTIERTLSRSEMAPPFHRTCRISLNYCAAYFFRKDGVCVVLAYFFPGRVRRLFLPGTLQVRSKHVNDTVRYGNFFLTPTVLIQILNRKSTEVLTLITMQRYTVKHSYWNIFISKCSVTTLTS